MSKKALIFYISKYSGHFHAANAIEKGLMELDRNIEIEKINALRYTNPILGSIINKAYLEIIKKKPEIWEHIYDNPDVMNKTKKARKALHKFNMSKVKKLLESRSPDVIFCTQAFPCGMVADYKRSSGRKIPLIGVLTDHAPHSYWLYDEVDIYVAPSEETAGILEKKGIPPGKIRVFGIPVDPKFRREHDIRGIKKSLGFSERDPVILIMGGSQGLGAVEEVVRLLLRDLEHNYQLLVVSGANKKLYKKLFRLKRSKGGTKLSVMSYVENIDELMEASDIIITKAGGMTMAEALVKKLPIMIVKPIPGHERMNTDYLVERGAAVEIQDFDQIPGMINGLFDLEGVLEKMKKNVEILSKPDSALDIARLAF
ncbi:MAG: glycosyltransferase [Candidatus Omnitrophota bacterium]|nr:glycosyltransferase [Candidatus Omnitrophota bacterium]